jgi:hypothetical protein
MKATLLAVSLILGAAAPALAATDVPAAPATDSSGVSTLNGQLVPVGDQNRYLYGYRRWNVSTNPLGMVLGSYGVSGSYALNANVAARADVSWYDPVGTNEGTGIELGLGAPIYFRKVYSGFFLEPGVLYRRLSQGDAHDTKVGPQVLLGYHWMWDSGLNVALAFGAGRNFGADSSASTDEKLFATGYLRFGYAF